GPAYSPYNIQLADTNPANGSGGLLTMASLLNNNGQPFDNSNVRGTPNIPRASAVDAEFGGAITDIAGPAAPARRPPPHVFLVGPGGADAGGTVAANTTAPGVVPPKTPYMPSNNMQYNVTNTGGAAGTWQINNTNITDGPNGAKTTTGISVLLRRLANPH